MAFQVSPGVNVSEIDLTTIIPAVSTSTGAIAGHFRWGPVLQRALIDSEDTLAKQFYEPNANTASDFFTAANFLAYGNSLYVVRVVKANTSSTDTGAARNATTNAANNKITLILNETDYVNKFNDGIVGVGPFVAKYPGELGNSLRISICPTANAFESTISGTLAFTNNSVSVLASNTVAASRIVAGDILLCGPDKQIIKVSSVSGPTITLQSKYTGNTATTTSATRRWEYFDNVPDAPGTSTSVARNGGSNDEMHIVVVDEDGRFSGTSGTILEVFAAVSKAAGAVDEVGNNIYFKDRLNNASRYVWFTSQLPAHTFAGASHLRAVNFGAGTQPTVAYSFTQGRDGNTPRSADYINGYNQFKSAETVDVSIILGSDANSTRAVHLINNIAEYRKDCIVVLSPLRSDVVDNSGYAGAEVDDIVAFRNTLPSTSYATLDTGWKYQYDKYNDVYRYVPGNGDTAGTMVRTDLERDPWFSPAGYNRGQIKNVIRMAYNPNKTDRDQLYKRGINPIVTFPGEGTILFGDKTLLTKPSAFDRINVRRLFIVLEKAIATAAKFTLFEFNDAFTRAQFKSIVEPFLRDVQGRRGITDFRVVCDESNNTGEVIDRNEFVGDIYIKPARSINFIQLNFVAVRTGVDFSEVVGKF
jgi:phage tail sheath protein FI